MSSSDFFIANKLRGIPLVSANRKLARTNDSIASIKDEEKRTIQLEKRDIDDSQATTNRGGVIFKTGGITATMSNLVNRKQSKIETTTMRPPTTKLPKTNRGNPTQNQIRSTTSRPRMIKTTTKRPQVRNSNSNPRRAENVSQTGPRAIGSATSTVASTQTINDSVTLKKFEKLVQSLSPEQQQQQTSTTAIPNLTRSTQILTTQPGNQRRTQQPMLSSRFSNFNDGRNANAGENWVLFNRPDGGYSFFEVLVFLSSSIMVSTIVLVIICNWIKSFKRKRAKKIIEDGSTQMQPQQQQQQQQQTQEKKIHQPNNLQQIDTDGISKLSMISSIVDSNSATPTANITEGTKLIDSGKRLIANSIDNQINETSVVNVTKTLDNIVNDTHEALKENISTSKNISKEIKQVVGNITNKAMAIVQPTENNATDSISVMSEPEKLKSPGKSEKVDLGVQKNINRSVSDLSGSPKLKKDTIDYLGLDKSMVPDDTSKPNANEAKITSSNHLAEISDISSAATEEDKAKSAVSHLGSLESIELPPTLVESIKKADARHAPKDEAPSPNLLLGEVEKPITDGNKSKQLKDDGKLKTSGPEKKNSAEQKMPSNSEKTTATATKSKIADKKSDADTMKSTIDPKSKDINKPKMNEIVNQNDRPDNPMGREVDRRISPGPDAQEPARARSSNKNKQEPSGSAEVKHHQVVVNKLDKRKTNLEIVDLRDDSVTGKMRKNGDAKDELITKLETGDTAGSWISMDGVAVVHPAPVSAQIQAQTTSVPLSSGQQQSSSNQSALMSPSDIIESRFNVDYKGKKRAQLVDGKATGSKDSADSKGTDYATNNIENELEQDNKMKNRKYFVYIVQDGHFTAKKECIARIELPPKRRITLAEMRQLIANSQDISLTSLRRNKFKFVTETYRLLNENEDATVLHQVYPTQGVFLKLNIPEQESQVYPYKGRGRISSNSTTPAPSSLSHTTIASRRKANTRQGEPGVTELDQDGLPAIEVDYAHGGDTNGPGYGRSRASSISRRAANRNSAPGGSFGRSKSSVVQGRSRGGNAISRGGKGGSQMTASNERLPSIGRSITPYRKLTPLGSPARTGKMLTNQSSNKQLTIGEAASDFGANVLSGAKKLLSSTFNL